MARFEGKTALITGASSGIGAACAKFLAEQGARLALCARSIDRLESVATELRDNYSCNIHTFKLDVGKRDETAKAITELPEDYSQIDILINNAGLAAGLDSVACASIDDWEQMIDTNLKGLLYVTRAILPGMVERNNGFIINIASTAGHVVYPGGSVYCATKHAVRAVAKTLQLELMDSNIRVSSVDPGMVQTEFSSVRFKGDQGKASSVYDGFTPLSADDVADAVCYCLSRPAHVMVSEIVLLATAQGDGRSVHRS